MSRNKYDKLQWAAINFFGNMPWELIILVTQLLSSREYYFETLACLEYFAERQFGRGWRLGPWDWWGVLQGHAPTAQDAAQGSAGVPPGPRCMYEYM